ncbi:MAG: hypothetical protein H5T61_14090, partial [Thermoflexales bacterium]|nr:hypothetical protein [Thermoflexales bacterium]
REALRLAAQGRRNREIATMLGIRPKTVGNHLRRKRCAFSDKKVGISLLTNGKVRCNINDKAFHPYCPKGGARCRRRGFPSRLSYWHWGL